MDYPAALGTVGRRLRECAVKIRMRVDISGTRNGVEWPPRGSVIDLPDEEAAAYCERGMAEPVTEFKDAEKAVAPDAEERGPMTTRSGPRGKTAGK
jgi:hypothetical protein